MDELCMQLFSPSSRGEEGTCHCCCPICLLLLMKIENLTRN